MATRPIEVRATCNLTEFHRLISEFAKRTNVPLEKTIPYQAASVWKAAGLMLRERNAREHETEIVYQTARKLGMVGRRNGHRGEAASTGITTVNVGLRGPYGRVWYSQLVGGGRMIHVPYYQAGLAKAARWTSGPSKGKRLPSTWESDVDAQVATYEGLLAQNRVALRYAPLLARRSFFDAIKDLGLDPAAIPPGGGKPASTMKAVGYDGREHKNGTGSIEKRNDGPIVRLANSYPTAVRRNFASLVNSALRRRISAMKNEIRRNVWDDAKAVHSRYKWLRFIGG